MAPGKPRSSYHFLRQLDCWCFRGFKLMETNSNLFSRYCWWFRIPVNSTVEVKVVYPIIYRVLYIPGGCSGFLPSTVPLGWGTPHDFKTFKRWYYPINTSTILSLYKVFDGRIIPGYWLWLIGILLILYYNPHTTGQTSRFTPVQLKSPCKRPKNMVTYNPQKIKVKWVPYK